MRVAGSGPVTMLWELDHRILCPSTWMNHCTNHIRPDVDGLKVGGQQASSPSVVVPTTSHYRPG